MDSVSAYVHVISDQDVAVRACGRACPDMNPLTLPAIPVPPPLSLSALIRAHPDLVIKVEWLEAMEADETIH